MELLNKMYIYRFHKNIKEFYRKGFEIMEEFVWAGKASQQWNIELKGLLLKHNFKQCHRYNLMFIREKNGRCCIILVYVDDLIMNGDDEESITEMKLHLDEAFSIKDLGKLRYFLVIEVARGNKGTMLNQRKYVIDIVNDTGIEGCNANSFLCPKGVEALCQRWRSY